MFTVAMTTAQIRHYLKHCSLEFTIISFESSSFFWFSRAACMVLTSCCTLVNELPIVATLLKWQKKEKKKKTPHSQTLAKKIKYSWIPVKAGITNVFFFCCSLLLPSEALLL